MGRRVKEPPPPEPLTQADMDADGTLAQLLLSSATIERQTDACLDLAWEEKQTDVLRAAAVRRLHATDPRVLIGRLTARIPSAPAAVSVHMMELLADVFRGLGGVDAGVNVLLADQIRSQDTTIAKGAIDVATRLKLREAYLPLREIASNRSSPLFATALEALVTLADPRAVSFFSKLLDDSSAPRDVIYRGLVAIGRPAALVLKQKLLDNDPDARRRALDALLAIAGPQDLSALYTYIEKFPPEGEEKTRIYATIARIEASPQPRPGSGQNN